MKLLFVSDSGDHLGCLEMSGDSVVIKKYKDEFAPEIVDAPEEDDNDEMEGKYSNSSEIEEKGKEMFKKDTMNAHEEEESPEYEDEEEKSPFLPKKQKRPGKMF